MAKCPEGHIAIKTALSAVDSLTADLTKAHKTFARDELKSLLTTLAGAQEFVEIDMLRHFLSGFKDAIETGDASSLLVQKGLRVKRVVDVEEFVESKFFLGLQGKVWPSVKENLWNIFHSPEHKHKHEVVLGGSIGCAKSFTSELGMLYILYQLSCYHNPQAEFGLAPGSTIYLIFQSISQQKAKKVLFEQFSQRLRGSEYFSRHFPFDKDFTSELRFPSNVQIIPVASGDTSALGMNIYSAILDEMCFMDRIENSTKARFTGEVEYDQAEKLYSTISRRLKSRFGKQGTIPGKLFLVSSANYPDDFISKKVKQNEELERAGVKSHIYVSIKSQWEARPPGTFLSEKFLVEIGDATRRSRIVSTVEDAVDPASVIEVPMDFHNDFLGDIEAAIRDLAGVGIGNSNSFLKQREKIHEAAKEHSKVFEGKSLFKKDSVDLTYFGQNVGVLLDEDFLSTWLDPLAKYYCHLDLALSGDSCGICIGHLGGYKEVGKSFEYDEGQGKYVPTKAGQKPVIIIDGVIEVRPPQSDEIDLNLLGDFLLLIAQRLNLVYVTADSYQSAAILQRVRKAFNLKGARIKSAVLSVDRDIAAYAEVKQCLRDDRILYPLCEKLLVELRDLQFDSKRVKVDHRVGGSKDIADSVAGVTYLISTVGQDKRSMNSNGTGTNTFRRIRSGRKRAG